MAGAKLLELVLRKGLKKFGVRVGVGGWVELWFGLDLGLRRVEVGFRISVGILVGVGIEIVRLCGWGELELGLGRAVAGRFSESVGLELESCLGRIGVRVGIWVVKVWVGVGVRIK